MAVIPAPPVPAAPAAATAPADMPSTAIVETPDELPADSVILFSASRRLLEGNRAYELEDIYAVSPQPGSTAQLIIPNAMQPPSSTAATSSPSAAPGRPVRSECL